MTVSTAQLSTQITALLTKWNAREAEFRAWLAGTPTGGPNGDGRYPLTDAAGTTVLVDCPAKLSDTVSGPADISVQAKLLSEAAREVTLGYRDSAANDAASTNAAKLATFEARNLTKQYRDDAAAHAANLQAARAGAESAAETVLNVRDEVVAAKDETVLARNDTLVARAEAGVARDAAEAFAASINPAILATKQELAAEVARVVGQAPETMNALDELAAAMGNDPNFATTIMNQIATKATLVHTHGMADIVGLQTALDGKQPVGSYSLVGHGHGIADISGLQTALNTKQPVGNYSLTGHGHTIAEVTGLQTALDGKQPAGQYALAGHQHVTMPIVDTRAAPRSPNDIAIQSLTAEFSNQFPVSDWHAALNVRGWDGAYTAWQLIGPASTGAHENFYLRSGVGASWNPMRKIWHDGNFNPSNYLPLTGGALNGDLSWNGFNSGNPRAARVGYSGGEYGGISYGINYTTGSERHTYAFPDAVTLVRLTDGLDVRAAPPGSTGTDVAWTEVLRANRTGTFNFLGNQVWHGGNFNPASKADVGHTHSYLPLGGGTINGLLQINSEYAGIHNPANNGGNFRFSNTLRSWAIGMLGAAGWDRWSVYDVTAGAERLSVDNQGTVRAHGSLRVDGNTIVLAGRSAFHWNANQSTYYAPPASGHLFCNETGGEVWAQINANALIVHGRNVLAELSGKAEAAHTHSYLPLTGGALSGNLSFTSARAQVVSVYDPVNTQGIWAMGPAYTLPLSGDPHSYGNHYGLAWSYNPGHGGPGTNPQSKPGLNHQLLLQMAGQTHTAIGAGIWTSGNITAMGDVFVRNNQTQPIRPSRLYRGDDGSPYYLEPRWTGSHWLLDGYLEGTYHAPVRVGYADNSGNASLLGGVEPSTGVGGPSIAQRTTNGYLFAQYFNQASGDNENPSVSQVMVTNGGDGYLRKASIGHLAASVAGQPGHRRIVSASQPAGMVEGDIWLQPI